MDKEKCIMLMVVNILDNGRRIIWMDKENGITMMVINTSDSGRRI